MKKLLLIAITLCLGTAGYSQASGSFYMLQLGTKTCLFKYTAQGDSMKVLTLTDTTDRLIDIKYSPHDTVHATNPRTHQEETKIISNPSFPYHIETEMSYTDFLLLLKSKFELKNPQRNFRVYSFNIYYQTADTGGLIRIKYPQPVEGVISRLNCLTKGGFILLSLKAADHDEVPIDAQGSFLALIHIRN